MIDREIKFDIGEIVYLKTDLDQWDRIVTALMIRQGSVLYGLSSYDSETFHYDFEISKEKDILKSIN